MSYHKTDTQKSINSQYVKVVITEIKGKEKYSIQIADTKCKLSKRTHTT